MRNTPFQNQKVHHLTEVESTNTYALELIANEKAVEGMLISTDYQTAGRGQMGSNWQSGRGQNLMMSLILQPKFLSIQQQFLISQITALSIVQVLDSYLPQKAWIKWPNDILIGKKKTAGILIQNILMGKCITYSVVGVGLNVNQASFPHLPFATSMKICSNRSFDLFNLRQKLSAEIKTLYQKLRNGSVSWVQQAYLDRLYGLMEAASFRIPKSAEVIHGQIIGVSTEGYLQIAQANGVIQYGFKEIEYILE